MAPAPGCQGLERIADGPVWIVDTPGNVERARLISEFDDRGGLVLAHAIKPRDQTADDAMKQRELAGND